MKQLPDSVVRLLRQHRSCCDERVRKIREAYGTLESYRATLTLEIIDRPDDARLAEFHQLYTSVFTLEDESEPIEGFAQVLEFNWDGHVQMEFGPFREPIFVLRDPATNDLVGAANFAIYAYPGRGADYSFDTSCQLNFLLIHEDQRGFGIAIDLLRHMESEVERFGTRHCGSHRSFTTCEQNNPLKMTDEQIAADALAALIDPYERSKWWQRRGFRRLELPYIQPPLNASLEPCRYLDYYARNPNKTDAGISTIPSTVLLEHLRRFFTVSVGKLAIDMAHDPDWLAMQAFLESREFTELSAT